MIKSLTQILEDTYENVDGDSFGMVLGNMYNINDTNTIIKFCKKYSLGYTVVNRRLEFVKIDTAYITSTLDELFKTIDKDKTLDYLDEYIKKLKE